MTCLRDATIRRLIEEGRIGIAPFNPKHLQPASLDVTLDKYFKVPITHEETAIEPYEKQELFQLQERAPGKAFVLHPGEFALASTFERIEMPNDIIARVEGKSSIGRLGLIVHTTAGFIDPGFCGYVTLELFNAMRLPIKLYPGMKIGQLAFFKLDGEVEEPYGSGKLGSKYADQERGPVESKYYQNAPPFAS